MEENMSAKRLLDKLKSPYLVQASQLYKPQKPLPPISLPARQIAREIDSLSGGRLALSQDFSSKEELRFLQSRKLRIFDEQCGRFFFMSLAKIRAVGADKSCVHCNTPAELEEIGGKVDIQQFVLQRSKFNTYFGRKNRIGDITDIYQFTCIRCQSFHYDAPFIWFLRDSPGTNACPRCERRFQAKTRSPRR
jgi:hypothetical protein